jgi:hypothetical protein
MTQLRRFARLNRESTRWLSHRQNLAIRYRNWLWSTVVDLSVLKRENSIF